MKPTTQQGPAWLCVADAATAMAVNNINVAIKALDALARMIEADPGCSSVTAAGEVIAAQVYIAECNRPNEAVARELWYRFVAMRGDAPINARLAMGGSGPHA